MASGYDLLKDEELDSVGLESSLYILQLCPVYCPVIYVLPYLYILPFKQSLVVLFIYLYP